MDISIVEQTLLEMEKKIAQFDGLVGKTSMPDAVKELLYQLNKDRRYLMNIIRIMEKELFSEERTTH